MFHLATFAGEDHLFAAGDWRGNTRSLAADLREVSGEGVELVLPINLERMMVATRAIEPNAEEDLAHHRRQFGRLTAVAEEHRRSIAEGASLRGQQFAHELVVRLVFAERFAQIGIEIVNRFDARVIRIRPQQIGPLVRPEVGVLGALQQGVDQPLALIAARVGNKCANVIGIRQSADHVNVRAPQERRFRSHSGGRQVQLLELVPDVAVDEMLSRQFLVNARLNLAGIGNNNLRDGKLIHEARHDRGFARYRASLDLAVGIHRGIDGFVRLIRRQRRDVALGVIGIEGRHAERKFVAKFEEPLRGFNGDALQGRRARYTSRRTLTKPIENDFVTPIARRESFAAAVRHLGRGFAKDQALLG